MPEIDAADVEHGGALVVGGLIWIAGYKRGGLLGHLLKGAGFALVSRGQRGYKRLYNILGLPMPLNPVRVGRRGILVESKLVVRRSPTDLYRIWRNVENLPVFMDHLKSVEEVSDIHSRWVAHGPAGMVIKWEAEIIRDVEDELIAWRSLEGSGVDSAGSVRFESIGPRLTMISVRLRYDPPADLLGAMIAKVFRNDPQAQIDHDLRRFKAIMELDPPKKPASKSAVSLR